MIELSHSSGTPWRRNDGGGAWPGGRRDQLERILAQRHGRDCAWRVTLHHCDCDFVLVDEQAVTVAQRTRLVRGDGVVTAAQRNGVTTQALDLEAAVRIRNARVVLGDVGVGKDPVVTRYATDGEPLRADDLALLRAHGRGLGTDNFEREIHGPWDALPMTQTLSAFRRDKNLHHASLVFVAAVSHGLFSERGEPQACLFVLRIEIQTV